jgi:hypothetical protein
MTTHSITEDEKHLLAVMSGERFLRMEGLSNEVPFFIYPFDPRRENDVRSATKRIVNNLQRQGIAVLEVNLYELSLTILEERGVLDRVLEIEATQTKSEFRELLQGMLDPEKHLAPAVQKRIDENPHDILFVTGVGEVFPYIRSHNVLNNLQSVSKEKPMLMFFPGEYKQSDTLGSSLVLFGRLTDDQYYRAKNILEQEA